MSHSSLNIRAVSHGKASQYGFTLIELMVVVLIVAILAALATASYNWSVTKARRGEAKTCVTQGAQFMDRFYSTNLRYDKTQAGAGVVLNTQCPADIGPYYTVSLSAVTATTYTVQAVPKGVQATRDAGCGTLAMNQTGTKTASGGGSGCW